MLNQLLKIGLTPNEISKHIMHQSRFTEVSCNSFILVPTKIFMKYEEVITFDFKIIKSWPSLFVLLMLTGCASTPSREPLPEDLINSTEISNISEFRFWGDESPNYLEDEHKYTKTILESEFYDTYKKPHNYLAVSGGGANGAYGAGLLYGWSKSGTRPEFTMVTGVSTGALTAPFAFLGSKYDETLKTIYTTISTKDIIKEESRTDIVFKLLRGILKATITDIEPFKKTIAKYVTEEIINDIAIEQKQGRRLFIGTFNLDAGRPVIWDIGKIAASNFPNKVELIREVMRASASIPIAFPSVLIPIEVNGETYDELHVDGGIGSQVFVYPAAVDWSVLTKLLQVEGKPNVYVIRNSLFHHEYIATKQEFIPIALRTVSSLIKSQGIGDIYTIYALCNRDGNEFNLASIPSSFNEESKEPFDTEYMNKLFDLGYRQGLAGYQWGKVPPSFGLE
jgi:predicted acylesterase/phospholipase RssA